MRSLDYASAASVDHALELLSHPSARPFAGGTDLLVQMRRVQPLPDAPEPLLVDLKGVSQLRELSVTDDLLVLGAAVTCAVVRDNETIRHHFPALAEAAGLVGGAAIQNRGTVGGNLCNAAPSADTIPALLVYKAQCRIAGPDGMRSVPVSGFCVGPGKTILKHGELLVAMEIAVPPAGSGAAYLRFIPRHEMDIAVAGAGVWMRIQKGTVTEARIALSAVGPTPLEVPEAARAMIGKPPTEATMIAAGEAAGAAARPIDDIRGGAEERRQLVSVLVRRAAGEAAARAEATHG